MTKNTLGDLNNHLFEQLERLNDEELQGDALNEEMHRARSISTVAEKIISTADLVLKAKIAYDENLQRDAVKPRMLEG